MTSLYSSAPTTSATRGALLTALLALVVLTGCDAVGSTDASAGASADAALAQKDKAPVRLLGDPTQEVGTSTLVRTEQGVLFRIKTSGLTPGDVVTVWTVVFNNPEYCDGPCDSPDLFVPEVEADAFYGAGRVVGPSGRTTFAGYAHLGANDGSFFPDFFGLPAAGLLDAEKAEIHFVLRSHGPAIPGLVDEMLHSYNAGCGPEFGGRPVPESLGTYGPNTCQHVQFSVHPGMM